MANLWYWRSPGMVYAGNFYANSKKEVKQEYKDYFNVKRVPNGWECWRA